MDNAVAELANFAERIERLRAEKKEAMAEYNEDIKQVRAEAKARGYTLKALDKVLGIRAMPDEDRAIVGVYLDRLGVFG